MRHRFARMASVFLTMALSLVLLQAPAVMCDPPGMQTTGTAEAQFVAYYFFTSKRCSTCRRIEQWTQAAIAEGFKDQIAAGRLQWQAVNVEKSENRHFIKEFQLYTKSVVIAEYEKGKPVRWAVLEKVWQLSRDKEKYNEYLVHETRSFMEKS